MFVRIAYISYRSFYALTFFNILHRKMDKNRLEAFSDGVLAIIITIMVLSMSTPEETTFVALRPVVPVFVYSALFISVFIGSIIIISCKLPSVLMVRYYGPIFIYYFGFL